MMESSGEAGNLNEFKLLFEVPWEVELDIVPVVLLVLFCPPPNIPLKKPVCKVYPPVSSKKLIL